MPEAKIRKPVSRMVFPRSREGHQAAPRAGNGDQRGVENRHSQDQKVCKPCRDMIGVFQAQF